MNRFQVVALMPREHGFAPREVFVLPTENTLPEGGVSLAHHLLPAEAEMVASLYMHSVSYVKPTNGLSAYSLARLLGIAAHHAVMHWAMPERRAHLRSQGFDPQGAEGSLYSELFVEMRNAVP